MCNFVIRPIKSYATVNVAASKVVTDKIPVAFENIVIERGTALDVKRVDSGYVYGIVDGIENEVCVNMDDYVHTFTANPDDIEKVRKEEHKAMGYDPNKKDSKKSQNIKAVEIMVVGSLLPTSV